MDRIHYAGESILTGTEIARALLEYAQALAGAVQSDTIDVPIVSAEGATVAANLLLGPASQLFTETEPGDGPELEDTALVADLHRRAALLRPSRPVFVTDGYGEPDTLDEL